MPLLAGSLHGITTQAQQPAASRTLTMQASWPASSTSIFALQQEERGELIER
jgi:hypothetical protein